MLVALKLTLLFLCPRPSSCPGASRLGLLAERTPDVPLPTPLLVAELGGYLGPEGSLLADIDGDGDDVEECMPFVMMPGGLLTLVVTDCRGVMVPESACCSRPSHVIKESPLFSCSARAAIGYSYRLYCRQTASFGKV